MKTILIVGAGRSATVLIDYLLRSATNKDRKIIVADSSLELAQRKTKSHPNARAVYLDVTNEKDRKALVNSSDLVISMLPVDLHLPLAKNCLQFGKHFFSASYESGEMRKWKDEILSKDLLFLNECGLDPGLDHLSAMQIIDREKKAGRKLIQFKSFCGGLLAPGSEDNPWQYKFTWNPKNVVLAGQGISRYIHDGEYKLIPYSQIFNRIEKVTFPGLGEFDAYPNRDSLQYRKVYGLDTIPTLLRGTLRRTGFCRSWNVPVQLGMTDNTLKLQLDKTFTKRMFTNIFLAYSKKKSVEEKLQELLPWTDGEVLSKLDWLGLFSDEVLPVSKGTPAEILQRILEEKWMLKEHDRDMVLMQHQFEVESGRERKRFTSSLKLIGESREFTAMAKAVGLPLAMAVDLFMDRQIDIRGLCLPIYPEIYKPLLENLQGEGIFFEEKEEEIV